MDRADNELDYMWNSQASNKYFVFIQDNVILKDYIVC